MKKQKRKLNIKRIFFAILLPLFFIIFGLCLISNLDFFKNALAYTEKNSPSFNLSTSGFEITKLDKNSNYLGLGQERTENKDGYFTTFTTIDDNKKVYLEYKQNGDTPWSSNSYWENTMETDGCGITAMSIILSGYEIKSTPEDLRKIYYPVLKSDNIAFELSNSYGIKNSGFYYDNKHINSKYIDEFLQTNRPILICVWNKPNCNRWTTDSHYMVLLASDSNGMVYISNPNRTR